MTFLMGLQLVFRMGKKQTGSIRLGLIWELCQEKALYETSEVSLNPWMIVVKTDEEVQTILEKRMPMSEAEGEILKELILKILKGSVSQPLIHDPQGSDRLLWSYRINKTHA